MKDCLSGRVTDVWSEGEGPACTLVVHAPEGDPGGTKIDVFAELDGSMALVLADFTLGAGPFSRVAYAVAVPGAARYMARVRRPVGTPGKLGVSLVCDRLTPAAWFGP